jgi:hypothetical protein
MDFADLLQQMIDDGTLDRALNDPTVSFGANGRPLIGAELLPDQLVEENEYDETALRYRTQIANAASRYSPPQIKEGAITGSVHVRLAEMDLASVLEGRTYDTLNKILAREQGSVEAMARYLDFFTRTVALGLAQLMEVWRWQAIVSAQITAVGMNGRAEPIPYLNPSGHRAAVGGDWASNAYDPWADIVNRATLLANKGYGRVRRIITSTQARAKLLGNQNLRERAGTMRLVGGEFVATSGRLTAAGLNALLTEDGLPAIETYDEIYHTTTGSGFYLPRDTMVFIGDTASNTTVSLSDGSIFRELQGTLGYTAIGTPTGRPDPGRMFYTEPKGGKPPRVLHQGWLTGLPVILEEEAIATLTGI